MTSVADAAPLNGSALRLSPAVVAKALIALIAGLIVIQVGLLTLVHGFGKPFVFGLVDVFDFGGEKNITAYFQSLLLLFCGLMLLVTGALQGPAGKERLPWVALGCVFLFLAVDEATMILEYTSAPVRAVFGTNWMPILAWVFPYFGGLVLLSIILTPWFLRLDRFTQIRFALAGCIFVVGALGFELLESVQVKEFLAVQPDLDLATLQDPTVDLIILFEESFEMIGAGLFLQTLFARLGGLTLNARA